MGWVDTAAGPGRPGLATIQVLAPAGPFPALFENPESPFAPWVSVAILMLLAAAAIAEFSARGVPGRLRIRSPPVKPRAWESDFCPSSVCRCVAGWVARVLRGPYRIHGLGARGGADVPHDLATTGAGGADH